MLAVLIFFYHDVAGTVPKVFTDVDLLCLNQAQQDNLMNIGGKGRYGEW